MAVQFDIVAKLRAETAQFIAGMKSSEVASTNLASSVGSASTMVGVGLAASVAVAGIALLKLGQNFHEAYKQIRVGTGETGEALKGLEESFKNVFAKTPASMKDVGTAITDLSVKLGLSGPELEAMSLQFIKLSRLTGTDLKGNIEAVTMVFKNFNVAATDQKSKLDLLYRASQKSGVSVEQLAGQMTSSGVVLRELGFDFDKSAALMGTFAKAGIDAGDVMPAFQFSLKTAGKAGVDASEQFKQAFDVIAAAPSTTEATGKAIDVFGGRAGPKLAAAIQQGKLSYEDYLKVIQDGTDTIAKSSSDVETFGSKLTKLGHQLQIALEPLAMGVLKAVNDAMKLLVPTFTFLIDGISNVVKAFEDLPTPIQIIVPLIAGLVIAWELVTAAVTVLSTAFAALYTAVLPIIMKGIMTLGFALGNLFAAMGMNIAMAYNFGAALATGIGGALGLLVVAWTAYNFLAGQGTSTNLAGSAAAKAFRTVLEGNAGEINKNTSALIAKTFADDKHFKALRDGKGDVATFASAITGSKDAIMAYHGEVGKFGNLNDFIDQVKKSAAAGDTYSQSLLALHDQGGQTWKSIDALAQGMMNQALAYDAAVSSDEVEMGMQKGLQTENDKTTATIKAQTDAMQKKTDQMRAATDPMYAALSAQSNLVKAQKDYNDTMKDGEKSEQDKKDAAIALTKAYGDYGFSLRDLDKAQTEAGKGSTAFKDYMAMAKALGLDPLAESTKTTLGAMYNLGTEMEKLKSPTDQYTNILKAMTMDGMDPAKIAAGKYKEKLEELTAKLAPDDPLRKNIADTQLTLYILGMTKPQIDLMLNSWAFWEDAKQVSAWLKTLNPTQAAIAGMTIAGAHADGGPVKAGSTYLVGEKGPELFTSSTSGMIIPNNALGQAAMTGAPASGGMTSVTYEINVNVAATADKASIGKALVESIAAYEQRSGSKWRS